jgi:Uma2 family endonuclease
MRYGIRDPLSPATFADIESLPETEIGEIIDGVLYVFGRMSAPHGYVKSALVGDLHGAEGWWILSEPGVQAGGSPEFVPDLAGWRRERVPELPRERWTVAPDWACEIVSLSTRAYDQRIKRPFYARIGIRHLWFFDLDVRTLTVSELINGRWVELGVHGEDDVIRAAPFDALELKLGELWPPTQGT